MKIENTDIEQFVTADLWQLAVTLTKAKELSNKILFKDSDLKNDKHLVEADEKILDVLSDVTNAIGVKMFFSLANSAEHNKLP